MNSSLTWHVVITRFSCRNIPNAAGVGPFSHWTLPNGLLDPRRLDFRFAVFEMTCAASLLSQTNQDFDWILIIDRQLPAHYRERLRSLLQSRQRTHLHEYDPAEDIGSGDWLKRYVPSRRENLLTTLLDDDDALPINFIEILQRELRSYDVQKLPVISAASRHCDQWELISSARAPFGYRCVWHRGNWVVSAGLSLLSPLGCNALTVLALHHQIADIWMINIRGDALRAMLVENWGLDSSRADDATRFVAAQLDQFQDRVASLRCDASLPGPAGFLDLTATVGAVVVSNHFTNDQFLRLLEPKGDRICVEGPESFPNVPVQLERFRNYAPFFRKAWSTYFRLLRAALPQRRSLRDRLRLFIWTSWRFFRV